MEHLGFNTSARRKINGVTIRGFSKVTVGNSSVTVTVTPLTLGAVSIKGQCNSVTLYSIKTFYLYYRYPIEPFKVFLRFYCYMEY